MAKRSQQDATLRNVRASKRRDETMAARVGRLEAQQREHDRKLRTLTRGLRGILARI